MKPLPASPKGRRQSKGGRHSNKVTKIVTKEGKDIIWVLKTQ